MDAAEKVTLSEADICRLFITPAIVAAGWNPESQIRQEVSFTKGRIIVRGSLVSRGRPKRADYILSIKPSIPLTPIEFVTGLASVPLGMKRGADRGMIDLAAGAEVDFPWCHRARY